MNDESAVAMRGGRLDDVPALLRLQDVFDTNRLKRRALVRAVGCASQSVFVAERNGEICGSAIAHMRRSSRRVRLYDLVVAVSAQRAGIGRALLRAVERRARSLGAVSVHLEVRTDNKTAQEFYRHDGYTLFGRYEDYYEDGCGALRMRKPLIRGPRSHRRPSHAFDSPIMV